MSADSTGSVARFQSIFAISIRFISTCHEPFQDSETRDEG